MYKYAIKLFVSLFFIFVFCNSYSQTKAKLKSGIYYVVKRGIQIKEKKGGKLHYIDSRPAVLFDQNTKFYMDVDQFGQPALYFQFDEMGSKKFFQATKKYIGKELGIIVDDELISCPKVMEPIKGGKAMITGLTAQELEEIKTKIKNETNHQHK